MNASQSIVIANTYAFKEGSRSVWSWFKDLKSKGLNPIAITMDGERGVIQAIRKIWPDVKIQRCLYHIQMQALIWLREHPKTEAAQQLKSLLESVCYIKSINERNKFIKAYKHWLNKHIGFIRALPTTQRAYLDLKKATALINNALKDMFHYLFDPNIPHTTNKLESFYSRLKPHYWAHRGLTHKHKLQYLQWYSYLKNQL
ncbi:MAG: transposase [Syntrophales bacterium LBB04]|nr:transposase [Syntrophales bacterium LBB04]